MTTEWGDSPFLKGNFAPVHEEHDDVSLDVIGELPRELEGCYVRTGPNPQFPPIGTYHWFDGDGMLHATQLRDGRANYSNRWVRTEGFEAERAAGKALWSGLSMPPSVVDGEAGYKNAANTALVWHDGRLLSLWEGGDPHAVRLPDLETLGRYDYGGALTHAFTAHPKVDAESGEMMFFGYSPIPPYLTYSVVSASGEIVHTAPIEIPTPVMMHDFAITQTRSIFLDLPIEFRLERLAEGKPPLEFNRERPSRFGIVDRRGTSADVQWFECDPCFIFHVANAHDEGDEVVMHACRMDEASLELDAPPREGVDTRPRMHRWRFDLATGGVKQEPLDDVLTEFPRVDDRLVGRPARYSYNASVVPDSGSGDDSALGFTGLTKYDLETGRNQTHVHGPGRTGGEPVFVPRPGSRDEDHGWVVTYVHDAAENRAELLVLNASDFDGEPQARVRIPHRVPYGFHGTWISADQLAGQR